jgi:hypothetical protein
MTAVPERRPVRTLLFLLFASGVAAFFVFWTARHRTPPIPADAEHRPALSEPACLLCHGPDGGAPRGRNHPLSDQCFNCHAR